MSKIISFPICPVCLNKVIFTFHIDKKSSMEEKEEEFEGLCKVALKEHIDFIHNGKKSEELKF